MAENSRNLFKQSCCRIILLTLISLLFTSCKSSSESFFATYQEQGLPGLKPLVDSNPELVNSVYNGVSILSFVVGVNDLETTRFLLESGADPNAVSPKFPDNSILGTAAYQGNAPICELLIDKGADINFEGTGGTALNVAARIKGTELRLRTKHQKATEPQARDDLNSDADKTIAFKRSLSVVKLLVSRGANVDSITDYGATPLYEAALTGNVEVVRFLLSKGADKDVVVEGVTIEQEMLRRVQNGSATKEDAEILKMVQK